MPDQTKRQVAARELWELAQEAVVMEPVMGLVDLFIDLGPDGPECRTEALDAWPIEVDTLKILEGSVIYMEARRPQAPPGWYGFALVGPGAVWGTTTDGALFIFLSRHGHTCPPSLLPGVPDIPPEVGSVDQMDEEAKVALTNALAKGPVATLLRRMTKAATTSS